MQTKIEQLNNLIILNNNHINEDRHESPIRNRRSRGLEGSVQKMRITIAALKKPKFNIHYNPNQINVINNSKELVQLRINKEDKEKDKEKVIKRESMPNFFANTVITDEDLLQFEYENKDKSQICIIQKNDFIKNGGCGLKISNFRYYIYISTCLFQENIEYGVYISNIRQKN
jgi:hypothetical protein